MTTLLGDKMFTNCNWRQHTVNQYFFIYILWTVHRDTHRWARPTRCTLFFISIKLSSTCFEQIIVHRQEVCTGNLQYFTMHHMRSLVADTIRLILGLGRGNVGLLLLLLLFLLLYNPTLPLPRTSINRIVSATRPLIRCMVKYSKLLVQTSWQMNNYLFETSSSSSFSNLSDERSKASSKTMPPHSAI